MKYKSLTYCLAATFFTASFFFSCTTELEPLSHGNETVAEGATVLRADVTIESPITVNTRLTQSPEDGWSFDYSYFVEGDTVGVFSRAGNMNLPTSDGKGGPLINIPMYFLEQKYPTTGGSTQSMYTLENDTVSMLPTSMSAEAIFMYYPYSPNMGSIYNYPNWEQYPNTTANANLMWDDAYPSLPGIELRVKAEDGSIRCRDFLEMVSADATWLKKGALRGTFRHAFSSLIIMRGEGFKNPVRKELQPDGTYEYFPDDRITVVLDVPISHIRPVSYSDHVRWTTQLFYQDGYTFDKNPMSSEDAKKWEAWRGEDWPYPAKNDEISVPAWYVIIPTIYHQNASWNNPQKTARPTVSEIQLYDDEGYLQHVTSFSLKTSDTATPTKQPYPWYRWPILIEMDELGPTVRPVSIDIWDEDGADKDLTEERPAGIHSASEYNAWASAYNTYITNGRSEEYAETLSTYGDLVDGTTWQFYISEFPVSTATDKQFMDNAMVNDLQDQLIGDNNFFNVTFTNLELSHPLFGKISGNGGLTNIDFQNIYVTTDQTVATGIIAREIDSEYGTGRSVTFTNCNIYNGTIISKGPVGILAGTTTNGRVIDCNFSGFVMGTTTSSDDFKYLFGINPAYRPTVQNCNYNNIIYSRIQ